MLFVLGAFFVAALSGAVIAIILFRHWKEIQLLNPGSIREEQERQQRDVLIKKRFERLGSGRLRPLIHVGKVGARHVQKLYQKTYNRLQAIEQFYRNTKSPFAALAPSDRERIKTLLTEARSLARDLKWADAERRYLEILGLDTRHVEAYKGLASIYLKQKWYPQAFETFQFVVKMKKADDMVYAGLAEIAEAEQKETLAEEMRLKAVETSPALPQRHAELAEYYMRHSQLQKALASVKRATELDAKSGKYLEMALDIALQMGNVKEARKYYDHLRLVTDDGVRFQSWREKIERLEAVKTEKAM